MSHKNCCPSKLFVTVLIGALLIGSFGTIAEADTKPEKLKITSTSFRNKGKIPIEYAFAQDVDQPEKNISPQLTWKTKRKDIKSYAIFMYDKHPKAKNFIHWFVTDIPANMTTLPKDFASTLTFDGHPTVKQQPNDLGGISYIGPIPPYGSGWHEYEIRIVGLSVETMDPNCSMATGCTLDHFLNGIKGKVLSEGKYSGKYKRDKPKEKMLD